MIVLGDISKETDKAGQNKQLKSRKWKQHQCILRIKVKKTWVSRKLIQQIRISSYQNP